MLCRSICFRLRGVFVERRGVLALRFPWSASIILVYSMRVQGGCCRRTPNYAESGLKQGLERGCLPPAKRGCCPAFASLASVMIIVAVFRLRFEAHRSGAARSAASAR